MEPFPFPCHPDRSEPEFPASLHWTGPRVRLSLKERRMMLDNATNLYRKFGVAKRRDLRFRGPFVEMFFDGAKRLTDLSREQRSVRGVEGPRRCLSCRCCSKLFNHPGPQVTIMLPAPDARSQSKGKPVVVRQERVSVVEI